jgi:hypothetical protein
VAYIRANTQTSNGWRPGAVRLGALLHPAAHLPDWKVGAARLEGNARRRRSRAIAHQAARGRLAAYHDAVVRRDRVALAGLQLGALDPGTQMVVGATYVFHFTGGFLGGSLNNTDIVGALAGDSNFTNVFGGQEGGVFSSNFFVSVVYAGQGSTVLGAGTEIATILTNSNQNVFANYTFISADGPAAGVAGAAPSPAGSPAPAGNPFPSGLTYPGGGSGAGNPGSPGDWFSQNWQLVGLGLAGAIVIGKLL